MMETKQKNVKSKCDVGYSKRDSPVASTQFVTKKDKQNPKPNFSDTIAAAS